MPDKKQFPLPKEPIKLVIWDLDDTFWDGTLSEGDIVPREENIKWVRKLTDLGVVNSICSKNNQTAVEEKLRELDIRDMFVFISVDWNSKGSRIREIIERMHLRSENVLFIDDNIGNLEEAAFYSPGLNIAHPTQIKELMASSMLAGKADPDHKRLDHYRLLERKEQARKESGSNEEFLYASQIRVDMIEDSSAYIDRIHEMIHRNNQLNYTKDRIDKEQVRQLFLSEDIRSGVVRVTDKYGDHGIVGCYAVKDNVVLQLVFSCRILGMGVEQWVYAQLGFPKLTAVGEVAVQLNQEKIPEWINARQTIDVPRSDSLIDDRKIIVYGTCPLRPTWSYLQQLFPATQFAQIDPEPSVCNLAAVCRENPETINKWLSNVNVFDANYSFFCDVFSSKTDAILVNLGSELNFFKYTSNIDGAYFYAPLLTDNTASKEILLEYTPSPATIEDLRRDISFLCENLAEGTMLLIQTVAEVIFPSKGRDSNYHQRVQINKLTEELAAKYDCIRIIDIRDLANRPSDFFNPWAYHFNRGIGYALAMKICNCIGVEEKTAEVEIFEEQLPKNAIRKTLNIDGYEIQYSLFIRNGIMHIDVETSAQNEYLYKFAFWRDRSLEYESEFTHESKHCLRIDVPGYWKVCIELQAKQKHLTFSTEEIDYNEYNYFKYADAGDKEYKNWLKSLEEFSYNNANYALIRKTIVSQICKLAACGVNVSAYFLNRDIYEISLFVGKEIADVLIPFLIHSPLKIKKIYTVDKIPGVATKGDIEVVLIDDIYSGIELGEGESLLYASDGLNLEKWKGIFTQKGVRTFYIWDILSVLMTETFFVKYIDDEKMPHTICVRTANLFPYQSFPYESIKANERSAFTTLFDDIGALTAVKNGNSLPAQFADIPKQELLETLLRPEFVTNRTTSAKVLLDKSGTYVNISQGRRHTVGQPNNCPRTIYLFGGALAFGCGVSDKYTISSALQKLVGDDYCVCNCSNYWHESEMGSMLRLIDSIDFKKEDIIILLMSNWQEATVPLRWHWLNWDALNEPVIKLDAFSLFRNADRPDYFLLPCAYTAECNGALAELIYKEIKYLLKD